MSGWIVAVRDVYQAGGKMKVCRMAATDKDIAVARMLGLLKPGFKGGPRESHIAELTERGRDFVEGRVRITYPRKKTGRPAFIDARWVATWLAHLPKANEIRL